MLLRKFTLDVDAEQLFTKFVYSDFKSFFRHLSNVKYIIGNPFSSEALWKLVDFYNINR
jgi:hypothetical protein